MVIYLENYKELNKTELIILLLNLLFDNFVMSPVETLLE